MEDDYFSDNEDQDEVRNEVVFPQPRPEGSMDLSGIPICRICDRLMEDAQPQSQLLCYHTYHTFCLTHFLFYHAGNRCPTCEVPIWNRAHYGLNAEMDEAIRQKSQERRETSLKQLEEAALGNKEMMKDLKIVKRSITEARKASRGFKSYITQNTHTFQEESAPLIAILKSMLAKRRTVSQSSVEAKVYRSKRAKASFYIRAFDQKYPGYTINTLSSIRKLKLPTRWELSRILWGIQRRLRRGIYIRG